MALYTGGVAEDLPADVTFLAAVLQGDQHLRIDQGVHTLLLVLGLTGILLLLLLQPGHTAAVTPSLLVDRLVLLQELC